MQRFDFAGWMEAERGRFGLFLAPLMAGGAVVYYALGAEPSLWAGPALGGAMLAATLAVRRWAAAYAACLAILALAIGFASASLATRRAPGVIEVPSHATIVTGRVVAVETLPAGRRVLLEAPHFDAGPAMARRVRVRLRADDATPLASGDTMRLRALLSRPAPPAYPGGWDLQRDAFFSGIGAYGYALGPAERLVQADGGEASAWVQALREAIAGRIAGVLAAPASGIAATLLTGSTTAIAPDDRAAFRDSGLAHLLAIAGLHIGIVMGLVFAATRFGLALSEQAALHWQIKSVAAVAALLAGGAYLVLTGAHVPIIRSFAMASLVTAGILVGRRAVSLRGLALAMAALVLIAPNEVVGVSFQMSFSAVLALIVGYATLRPWLARLHGAHWSRRLLAHVVGLALTSALAGTFSAPYGAYHFGHVQLYFVLANMIAVPLTAMLVMPAGLIALALMPVHLEVLALRPMGWGIDMINAIAHAVARLPAATVAVSAMPPWGIVVFSVGLAWLGLWRTRPRLAGIVAMAIGLASPLFETPPDILVSADARLIGYRRGPTMLVQTTAGGSGFTLDAWRQYWRLDDVQRLDCAATHCVLQPRPDGPAALLLRGDADASVCGQALLISAEPIRLRCPARVPWVDRFTVWRTGAQAVWLGPGAIRVRSDRDVRGTRPWVLGPPLAGRVPANTRPALVETLPEE